MGQKSRGSESRWELEDWTASGKVLLPLGLIALTGREVFPLKGEHDGNPVTW